MCSFTEAWADAEFVQQAAAQLPWCYQLALPDKLSEGCTGVDLSVFCLGRIQ